MMVGTILVQLRSTVLAAVKRKQPVAVRVAGGKKLVLGCCLVRRDDQSSIELPASRGLVVLATMPAQKPGVGTLFGYNEVHH